MGAYCVDEMTCGEVPDTDDRVSGGGDDPAAVVGEAEIVDGGGRAEEFADDASAGDVDDADAVVGAVYGEKVARSVLSQGCY